MIIRKLSKNHYKNKGGTKYFINCSNITNEENSIIPQDILKNISDISILRAIINYSKHIKKNKNIVIKIAHKDKTNKKEYDISLILQNIHGFIKHICLFNCFDDTYNYITINHKVPKQICTAENIYQNDNYILVSPYINGGSIRNFNWNLENIIILKSIIKQTIMSLMYAFIEYGFLHNDIHLDNILLKRTKQHIIKYNDIVIDTNGYKTVIMDFDKSFINVNIENTTFYWSDIYNIMSRLNYDLQNKIIPTNGYNNIMDFISNAKINNYHHKKSIELLQIIDKLEFILGKPLQILSYNPNII